MNQRIQQLLGLATYDVLGVKQVDQKQFAELIVKECAQQAHDLADVLSMHRDKAGAEIAESIGNTIKEHFGVEE
jgi:hypothetical protein